MNLTADAVAKNAQVLNPKASGGPQSPSQKGALWSRFKRALNSDQGRKRPLECRIKPLRQVNTRQNTSRKSKGC